MRRSGFIKEPRSGRDSGGMFLRRRAAVRLGQRVAYFTEGAFPHSDGAIMATSPERAVVDLRDGGDGALMGGELGQGGVGADKHGAGVDLLGLLLLGFLGPQNDLPGGIRRQQVAVAQRQQGRDLGGVAEEGAQPLVGVRVPAADGAVAAARPHLLVAVAQYQRRDLVVVSTELPLLQVGWQGCCAVACCCAVVGNDAHVACC